MISRVEGAIEKFTDNSILMKMMPGISWDILLPSGVLNRLKSSNVSGSTLSLHTLEYIESPSGGGNAYPYLIGFTDENDREFFRLFTTVDGVGFKKALKALTKPVKEIATAIETGDMELIKQMPGLGGRTAEKVIATLHGKVTKFALLKESEPLVAEKKKPDANAVEGDALAVLQQLGYSEREAKQMIEKALVDNPKIKALEELINLIFKKGLLASG
ncbi:MAG: hypothetical protein CO189_02155 [candidate division Zixibacteria bacterium CG_4_9_14_3_um_filter_46_8]|nr:MAG: hypothetical protein CO189_02155 [candidate division Zixibacteria bacterium CG_4_9_14_3_um_filter_46_8]